MCKCGFLKIGYCAWSQEGKRWPISQNKISGLYVNHSWRGKWLWRSLWWSKSRAAMHLWGSSQAQLHQHLWTFWGKSCVRNLGQMSFELPRIAPSTGWDPMLMPVKRSWLYLALKCFFLCSWYFYSLLNDTLPCFPLTFSFIILLDL